MYGLFKKCRFLCYVVLWFLVAGASPGLEVRTQSGKLTVHVQGAPLREVLEAVTAQTGITFKTVGPGPIPMDAISEEFTDLSMDQGIARLLSRWDYALMKDPDAGGLKEVYLFISGNAPGTADARPKTAPGSVHEETGKDLAEDQIRQAIELVRKARNPDEEAKAVLNLQHFHDEQTLQVLKPALLSVSPKVRLAALEAIFLREVRDPVILEEVRQVSIRDPDPEVREKALYMARNMVPDVYREGDDTSFWMNP